MANNLPANRPTTETVKSLMAKPAYAERFNEVLKDRAPQFIGSLTALASQKHIANCQPQSVIAAAFVAATLDLPIQPSLGFAHVVPYKGVASFQMGWKGYVQLAMRSGQYRRIAAYPINAEALIGVDEFMEPIIAASALDDTKPAVGYVAAWELINGFKKAAYWSRERVEHHAARYSQAFQSGRRESPWFTNFDAMALKTVLSNELRRWGVLSVQMQKALSEDQTARTDLDAEPIYFDGAQETDSGIVSGSGNTAALEALNKKNPAEKVKPEAEPQQKQEPTTGELIACPNLDGRDVDASRCRTDCNDFVGCPSFLEE